MVLEFIQQLLRLLIFLDAHTPRCRQVISRANALSKIFSPKINEIQLTTEQRGSEEKLA